MLLNAIIAGTLAGLASAAPAAPRGLSKRTSHAASPVTDADILNYALTLEHLEATFYREGLAQFQQSDFEAAGFDAAFFESIQAVAKDEATHVDFLTQALGAAGAPAVQECTYEFGITDVNSFIATAGILEGVGVTAYLGAAALIIDKTTLTAAGSILTVEARHSSILRQSQKQIPIPQPFDAPLTLNSVFSLASPFIVECPPENPALPVEAFPALTLGGEAGAKISTGQEITILTEGYTLVPSPGDSLFAAFISVDGPKSVPATPMEGGFTAQVPEGVAGQSYVVLTAAQDVVTDDVTAAGPIIVEIEGSI